MCIRDSYILGASCHNEKELIQAKKLNVNYAFISPVLNTNSHLTETPLGWANFKNLAKKANFPVYALGGMSLLDLEIAKEHGAYGIAMKSAINNLSLLK